MAFVMKEVNHQVARHSITLDRVTLPPYARMPFGHVLHKEHVTISLRLED
jgi:hypothetical protein